MQLSSLIVWKNFIILVSISQVSISPLVRQNNYLAMLDQMLLPYFGVKHLFQHAQFFKWILQNFQEHIWCCHTTLQFPTPGYREQLLKKKHSVLLHTAANKKIAIQNALLQVLIGCCKKLRTYNFKAPQIPFTFHKNKGNTCPKLWNVTFCKFEG